MATKNLPPAFNTQFLDPTTGAELAGGLVHTYISGTTTNQTTWQDQAGTTTNTNPIVLDAAGQCRMWLDPALSYTILWTRSDGSGGRSVDNVGGSALATGIVTSVNGLTGAVVLNAPLIPFTTGTSTTWFVGTDVGAALDSIITHVDNAIPAASVPIVDAGNFYTSTNVEGALQEIGARSSHGALLRITPFTATGTWTKGTDVSFVVVKGVGGGGGSTTNAAGGGGGGGGGYFEKIVTTPGSSETVTIGAGGAPGAVGSSTSFGTWATALGGGTPIGALPVIGGAGGTATGGTLNLAGNGGGAGGNTSANFMYGHGGGSYWGGGAPGNWNQSTGSPGGTNTGGGGAGGTSGGSAGGSGLVLIYEYS